MLRSRDAAGGPIRLVVFLTRGLSLQAWQRQGILERELALYRALRPSVERISLVTYGSEVDQALTPEGMTVLCNRWRLPCACYQRLLPLLHRRELSTATVFKTNQANGAEAAVWARRVHPRARLIVRCGYLWSLNAQRAAGGAATREVRRATRRERAVFAAADAVAVTTEPGRRYVLERYGLPAHRVRVIPNYVNTALFGSVYRATGQGRRVLFVGRLHEEKNLVALIEALAGSDLQLTLIGDGAIRPLLERRACELGVNVRLLGWQPHEALRAHMAQADVFILPSRYENHPKALLEAMAAGLPVIGTDVPGIRELIEHRRTGLLCGTSPQAIRAALLEVLADGPLRERMGREARAVIAGQFSLERVVGLERDLLQELTSSGREARAGAIASPVSVAEGIR